MTTGVMNWTLDKERAMPQESPMPRLAQQRPRPSYRLCGGSTGINAYELTTYWAVNEGVTRAVEWASGRRVNEPGSLDPFLGVSAAGNQ